MGELCNFKFYCYSRLDEEVNEETFIAKGYKKNNGKTLFFKNNNQYKFVIEDDSLEVRVNNSTYLFNLNKKTNASIRIEGFVFNALIETKKLEISTEKIEIEYVIDFSSFKGEYKIIVELY